MPEDVTEAPEFELLHTGSEHDTLNQVRAWAAACMSALLPRGRTFLATRIDLANGGDRYSAVEFLDGVSERIRTSRGPCSLTATGFWSGQPVDSEGSNIAAQVVSDGSGCWQAFVVSWRVSVSMHNPAGEPPGVPRVPGELSMEPVGIPTPPEFVLRMLGSGTSINVALRGTGPYFALIGPPAQLEPAPAARVLPVCLVYDDTAPDAYGSRYARVVRLLRIWRARLVSGGYDWADVGETEPSPELVNRIRQDFARQFASHERDQFIPPYRSIYVQYADGHLRLSVEYEQLRLCVDVPTTSQPAAVPPRDSVVPVVLVGADTSATVAGPDLEPVVRWLRAAHALLAPDYRQIHGWGAPTPESLRAVQSWVVAELNTLAAAYVRIPRCVVSVQRDSAFLRLAVTCPSVSLYVSVYMGWSLPEREANQVLSGASSLLPAADARKKADVASPAPAVVPELRPNTRTAWLDLFEDEPDPGAQ